MLILLDDYLNISLIGYIVEHQACNYISMEFPPHTYKEFDENISQFVSSLVLAPQNE